MENPNAWKIWLKKNYPKMKRSGPVGIVKSTSSIRGYNCICGAYISESSRYQRTRKVRKFIDLHNEKCLPLEVKVAEKL